MKKLLLLALFVGFGLAGFAEDEKEETTEKEVTTEERAPSRYVYDRRTGTHRLADVLDLEEDY